MPRPATATAALPGRPHLWMGVLGLGLAGCTIRESDLLRWSIQSVSAGAAHTCGVDGGGKVHCWGADDHGQASPPDGTFEAVSAGGRFSCGLRESGAVECWGDIEVDELTTRILGDFNANEVSAGASHACALLGSTEWCWGDLGEDLPAPDDIEFESISAGDGFTCGIEDGWSDVYCWGAIGLRILGTHEVVSAADGYACALRRGVYDAHLECVGSVPSDYPSGVEYRPGETGSGSGNATHIASGARHLCLIRSDGRVGCFGDDSSGQASPPAGTFTSITAGAEHTCGIHERRGLLCWGSDEEGQSTPTFTGSE